jgi:hypothetical protein
MDSGDNIRRNIIPAGAREVLVVLFLNVIYIAAYWVILRRNILLSGAPIILLFFLGHIILQIKKG